MLLALLAVLVALGRARHTSGGGPEDKQKVSAFKFPKWIIDSSRAPGNAVTAVDYDLLETNAEGMYSAILPDHTVQVVSALRRHYPYMFVKPPPAIAILDTTANIGGDSVNFLHNLPSANLTALEINSDNIPVLEHNLGAAKVAHRAAVVHADAVEFVAHRDDTAPKFDFVYIDPPWGGPHGDWKSADAFMLHLGETPVYEFVNQIFARGLSNRILLKVPPNFDGRTFQANLAKAKYDIQVEQVKRYAPWRRRRDTPQDNPVGYLLCFITLIDPAPQKS